MSRPTGRKIAGAVAAGVICVAIFTVIALSAGEAKNYGTSLHKSGAGMQFWYEAKDGFMSLTGIPYDSLPCKSCHPDNCKKCHVKSMKAADTRDMTVCEGCHTREKATFEMDKAAGSLDVHIAKGKICHDCHKSADFDDIHGNGTAYKTLYDAGAVNAKCENCHPADKMPDIDSHKKHKDKLACPACHTKSTTSCTNCHFDSFLKDQKEEGNFMIAKDWTMLVNVNGKITTGSAMTLVTKDKKFIAYSPFYTHSVQKQAKKCEDCHANEAVKLIKDGQKIAMNKMVDGKVVNWSGTVPLVADMLEWTFYNKNGAEWVPITGGDAPVVQYVGGAAPLTEKQLKMLQAPFKTK